MQFTIATAALVFASVVAALPQASSANVCNTGSLQCCNMSLSLLMAQYPNILCLCYTGQSVQSATDSPAASLLGLLGVVVGSVDAQVGLTCSPISVIAVAGNSWYGTIQPVCSSFTTD